MGFMNNTFLQSIFLLNFVFLMMHETDAAYWKEWRVFVKTGTSLSDQKGLTIFILARIPICIPLLYGMVNITRVSGFVISFIFSGFLIIHFFLHMSARKTFDGFKWPISYFIQFGMLLLSVLQFSTTLYLFRP